MTEEELRQGIKDIMKTATPTERWLITPLSWTDYKTMQRHYKYDDDDLVKFDSTPTGLKIAALYKEYRSNKENDT